MSGPTREAIVATARESIARGSKSFAAASLLFDRPTRERAWLLYAWCRRCDDIADGQDHGHGMTRVSDAPARLAEVRAKTEAALAGESPSRIAITAALDGLFAQPGGERIDVIVNACTHFPLLVNDMAAVAPQVRFVDGGPGIARRVAHLTAGQDWPATPASHRLVFTQLAAREQRLAQRLRARGFCAAEAL